MHARTQDGKKHETGFFLKELGAPLIKLLEAGYDVEVDTVVMLLPKFRSIKDKLLNRVLNNNDYNIKQASANLDLHLHSMIICVKMQS